MSDLKQWSATHKKWVDAFVIELRLEGVSGATIGDELTTVFSHCEETGEAPEQSFGAPKDYARSLGHPVPEQPGEYVSIVLPMLLQVFILFVFTYSMRAVANAHNFMLNGVVLGCWAGSLVVILAMIFGLRIRTLIEKPWTLILGFILAIGLGVSGAIASQKDLPLIVNVPAMPVAVGSGVLLLVATAWAVRSSYKTAKEDDDALVSPLDSGQEQERAKKSSTMVSVLPALLIPLYAVIDTLISFWMV